VCATTTIFGQFCRAQDASTGVHCRKVVMFVDNCATDLLDMLFMWSIKCVLTTKLCMYDAFHKDWIYLGAEKNLSLCS